MTFLIKRGTRSNLETIFHPTSPALPIITLISTFQVPFVPGKEVYVFLPSRLCLCHSLPGSQPSPNSLLSTRQSPTLSTHGFHEACPNVTASMIFPSTLQTYYLPLHPGNYHSDKPSLFIFSSVTPISLTRC